MADNKLLQAILDQIVALKTETVSGFKTVTERLDKLGEQIAELEDDTPTIKEFDDLKGRVEHLETRFASA
ncbi:MAG: hypothetical protein M1484_04190 [Patescibacteria group bacterium]|nr:hypothetical protein [Patescibacteria group bacterium]MCL5432259.1 hypothetical protein [Patescibacteria group bacterium]